eukprot:jgi/Ulvmu1/1407/UM011_0136.1
MANVPLSNGTQAILDEFASKRGLSRRAIAEMRNSLAEGSSQWVDTLASGSASQRRPPRSTGKLKVPKSCRRPPVFYQFPLPQRRLQQSIAKLTNNYERDQYTRSQLISDASAQRKEDQLLFEYGKEGLREMRRLQAEQRVAITAQKECVPDDQVGPRDALVEQIFKEIEERLHFQQDMEGVRDAQELCRVVKLEVAQRISELARLGVDVSAARKQAPVDIGIVPLSR